VELMLSREVDVTLSIHRCDGDRVADFVVFDPHDFDVPVHVGRNLAALPGTAPRIGGQLPGSPQSQR
jgi:hypothetical protein